MGWFDIAKDVKKVLIEAGKADLFEKVAGMMEKAVETEEKKLEMLKKITELEKTVDDLNEKLKLKKELKYHPRYQCYWMKGEDGNPTGSPFCSKCFDRDRTAIRLSRRSPKHGDWFCPNCKNDFFIIWDVHSPPPKSFDKS